MEKIKRHGNYEIRYNDNMANNIQKIAKIALKDESDVRLIGFFSKIFSFILTITIILTLQNKELNQDISNLLNVLGWVFAILTAFLFVSNRTKLIKYKNITDLYPKEIINLLKFFKYLNNYDMLDPAEEKNNYVFTFKDKDDYIERVKIKKFFYVEKEKYKDTCTIAMDFTEFNYKEYFEDFFKNYE